MITFDYSRSTGKMRFTEDGKAVLADRIAGRWKFLKANPDGKLDVDCGLVVKGGTAYVYAPDGSKPQTAGEIVNVEPAHDHSGCVIATDKPFPQNHESHWRLCYAREKATVGDDFHWRLRDERTGDLWFVKGYEGMADVDYFDKGSHVFVTGPATVDENGLAHFA